MLWLAFNIRERTFDSNRFWQHLVAEYGVLIFLLAVPRDCHTSGEESHVPQEGEAYGESTVHAKDPNRGERTRDADPEGDHVREGGDGDRDGRLGHGVAHALRHRQLHRGSPPGGKHYERVVDTDTCEEWR